MVNLSAEIDEEQNSAFEEVLERNPWNKTSVVRALLAYFLSLTPSEQEVLVKTHHVKKKVKKRKEEIDR